MNSSFRQSEGKHSSSRAYNLGDEVVNTTNNTKGESIKYILHNVDLLNIASINTTTSSSSQVHVENPTNISTDNNTGNNNENLIDLSDQSPFYKIDDNVLFKNTPATITDIIKPDDPFEDNSYLIKNNAEMTKVVIMNQIHMNNIPRDIAFSTPSASVSLHSTDVSYKSNYTKRSTLSSQSLEIINKVKYYLQISN